MELAKIFTEQSGSPSFKIGEVQVECPTYLLFVSVHLTEEEAAIYQRRVKQSPLLHWHTGPNERIQLADGNRITLMSNGRQQPMTDEELVEYGYSFVATLKLWMGIT